MSAARPLAAGLLWLVTTGLAGAATAQGAGSTEAMPPVGTWGGPGLVDMPVATPMPDGRISAAFAALGPLSRTSFGFQAGPRIAGGFRYTRAEGLLPGDGDWADAAFDLRLTLLAPAAGRPAVTLGFQDILGTGLSSGEYLVATQALAHGLSVSAGIGWGRYGQSGALADGGARPTLSDRAEGGPDAWFTGPAGVFAGLSWAATDRLTFAIEYSADRYETEVAAGLIDRPAAWNAGLSYEVSEGVRLGAYTLGGQEIGFTLSLAVDPKRSPALGPRIGAPPPVLPRGAGTHEPGTTASLAGPLSRVLAADGMRLEAFEIRGTRVELRLSNSRHEAWPQALGRAARTLTRGLPPEVETLVLVAVEDGLAVTSVTLARSDLEAL
ncbi:MAG: YjbH domain-containing protein, partial [Rhodobacteraceae bacterium]|nr:YjbH domain-containing protein [Paracoccaceae bacterium]